MNSRCKKICIILILLAIAAGFFLFRVKIKWAWQDITSRSLPAEQPFIKNSQPETLPDEDYLKNFNQPAVKNETPADTLADTKEPAGKSDENNLSAKTINLKVPFILQAPFSVWDENFKEACEETSLLMIVYYYQNSSFTKQSVADEILRLIGWQKINWQKHGDLTVQKTAELAVQTLEIKKTEIIDNPTAEVIKDLLNQGLPVIMPVAGRELNNPYFRQPGPIYHMLVIKGYDGHGNFITNDPGIGRGKDYLYPENILLSALHDWDETDILNGAKKILVIYP